MRSHVSFPRASSALAAAVVLIGLGSVPVAHAQQLPTPPLPAPPPASAFTTTGGRPPTTWIKLGARSGDSASGSIGSQGDALDDAAMEPLRLGLYTPFVPPPWNDPGCGESPEQSGSLTGMSSLPAQQILGLKVFGPATPHASTYAIRAPRLSLFGMSRLGCGLGSAIGGGATFTLPLRQSTFFVLSGGAIYLPHGAAGKPVGGSQARADIVFAGEGGRSLSVGVGVMQGTPRVSVGGVF